MVAWRRVARVTDGTVARHVLRLPRRLGHYARLDHRTPGSCTRTDGGDDAAKANEEAVGACHRHATAPDALGYFVGDYEGLDLAGGGLKPGFKPFLVRANSGHAANRTDVFATTASTSP